MKGMKGWGGGAWKERLLFESAAGFDLVVFLGVFLLGWLRVHVLLDLCAK
jgi:hypothetical protein